MAEEQRAAMLADKARLQQERLAAQIRKASGMGGLVCFGSEH